MTASESNILKPWGQNQLLACALELLEPNFTTKQLLYKHERIVPLSRLNLNDNLRTQTKPKEVDEHNHGIAPEFQWPDTSMWVGRDGWATLGEMHQIQVSLETRPGEQVRPYEILEDTKS